MDHRTLESQMFIAQISIPKQKLKRNFKKIEGSIRNLKFFFVEFFGLGKCVFRGFFLPTLRFAYVLCRPEVS